MLRQRRAAAAAEGGGAGGGGWLAVVSVKPLGCVHEQKAVWRYHPTPTGLLASAQGSRMVAAAELPCWQTQLHAPPIAALRCAQSLRGAARGADQRHSPTAPDQTAALWAVGHRFPPSPRPAGQTGPRRIPSEQGAGRGATATARAPPPPPNSAALLPAAGTARSYARMPRWRRCTTWGASWGREVRRPCRRVERRRPPPPKPPPCIFCKCAAAGAPWPPVLPPCAAAAAAAGYSRVKLATHRQSGQQYACKIIPLPKPGKAVNEYLSDRGAIMKVPGCWCFGDGSCWGRCWGCCRCC